MENQEEQVVSISEFFLILWKKKIIIIITTVLMLILGFVLVSFVYNPSVKYYSTTFRYKIPELAEGQYLDGSTFNYIDIISESALVNVKESNANYANVSVDKLLNNSGIEILRYIGSDSEFIENTYIINIGIKYFPSREVAKSFVQDLIDITLNKNLRIIDTQNFDSYLNLSESALSYTTQIDYLISQSEFLTLEYLNLVTDFNDVLLSDGKRISEHRLEVEKFLTENNISILNTTANVNYYVKSEEELAQLQAQLSSLQQEKALNNAKINSLKTALADLIAIYGSSSTVLSDTSFTVPIAELTTANAAIDQEILVITSKLALGIHTADEFDDDIEYIFNQLMQFTDDYADVYKEVYSTNSRVYYYVTSIIETEGGISSILSALISGIIGAIGSAIVIIIIVTNKKEFKFKGKTKEETV